MRLAAAVCVAAALTACGGHATRHYLVYSEQTGGAVVLALPDGTHAHRIAHGEWPALSPDGRWVAFVAENDKLFVVSTRGGKPRFLARVESWPVWSPSSDRIATLTGDALVSVDLHGRLVTLDRNGDAGSGGWAFSPDGRRLVYTTDGGLVIGRAAGGHSHALTRRPATTPVWGERWIAFGLNGGIWRIHPDGSGLERVLAAPAHPGRNGVWGFYPVAWTAGDAGLLAEIAVPDAWDVAIRVDPKTGRYRHVRGYPVALSHDGRVALLTVGRNGPHEIVAAPFAGAGRGRILVRGDVCCPSWNR